MIEDKKISVALAAYNGSKFITEQLDSIINQSFAPDEIIVCDDCSTDDTFNILKEYAQEHPIVNVYENEVNLGFVKNFEKAAKLCTGDYILFSGQDDIWTFDHIEMLVNNLPGYDLVCGNAEYMTMDGQLTGRTRKPLFFHQDGDIRIDFRKMIFTHYAQGAAMLIKLLLVLIIKRFIQDMYLMVVVLF